MTKSELEHRAKRIAGHRLSRVRYFEIAYDDGHPYWNIDERYHTLDFGVDLEMQDSSVFGVTWDWDFCNYNVSIENRLLSTCLKSFTCWDVTHKWQWNGLLFKLIQDVTVFWVRIEECIRCKESGEDKLEMIECPYAIRLDFENGAGVYIAALEITGDGKVYDLQDDITVIFDESTARKCRIGESTL